MTTSMDQRSRVQRRWSKSRRSKRSSKWNRKSRNMARRNYNKNRSKLKNAKGIKWVVTTH